MLAVREKIDLKCRSFRVASITNGITMALFVLADWNFTRIVLSKLKPLRILLEIIFGQPPEDSSSIILDEYAHVLDALVPLLQKTGGK